MKIYGIEKLTLVDYDGYCACILFTGACNFCCPFCQNSALVVGSLPEPINQEEIDNYLALRTKVLDAVVVSGGEPTIHSDLPEYLKRIKDKFGYKIKLDTNGSNPEMLKKLVDKQLIDYVAMDIKNSLDYYDVTIGIENYNASKIKESIDYLLGNNIDYEFRTTLVYELHSMDNIKKIAKLIKGAKRYYLQKFEDKGGNIAYGLTAIPKEEALKYVEYMKEYVQKIELRGY